MGVPLAYRETPQSPVSYDYDESSIIDEAHFLTESTKGIVDAIVKSVNVDTATFENTALPFAEDENSSFPRSMIILQLPGQHKDAELRRAAFKARTIMEKGKLAVYMRSDYAALVRTVWQKSQQLATGGTHNADHDEDLLYLNKFYERFEANGASIQDSATRERFQELRRRAKEISHIALGHINADASGIWLTRDELAGLPEEAFTRYKQRLHEDQTQFFITSKYPDNGPIFKHAIHEETRRRVYYYLHNRHPENVPLYREMFLLRDEQARLSGYLNHAALKTKSQMVRKPEVVNDFLENLMKQTQQRQDHEFAAVETLMAKDNVQPYDWNFNFYLSRLRRQEAGSVDTDKVAEYFPLDHVLKSILKIFGNMFSLRFDAVEPKPNEIWHESVKMFAVWRGSDPSEFLGYYYLDLFHREGKHAHFSHFTLSPGFVNTAGKRHYPSSVAVCQFIPPTTTKPSLLTTDLVLRLSSQVGQALHNLLSQTRYAALHGLKGDHLFTKAIAKLFQHLVWNHDNIKEMSCHYSYLCPEFHDAWLDSQPTASPEQPPRQFSDEVIHKIMELKESSSIQSIRQNLQMAMFDMRVHSPGSRAELENTEFAKLYNSTIREATGCMGSREYDGSETQAFSHFKLIMGSFDVGYYVHLL